MTARHPATCPHCQAALACAECGCEVMFASHRSGADHRMFHAIVSLAYLNWPKRDDVYQPLGRDNLYGWLLVEADYCEPPVEIESRNMEFVSAICARLLSALKDKVHYWRIVETPKGVQVILPKSLSYKTAGKRQFEDTRSAVYEIIETTLGVKIEDLKREAKLAA